MKIYKTIGITEEMLNDAAAISEKYCVIARGINKSVLTGFYSCPFCGEKPDVREWFIKGVPNKKNYAVVCKHCGYRLSEPYQFNNPAKAIFFWNRNALALGIWKGEKDGE